MLKGIITDIQRASTHDGPGIRTTVFFKGCPLNCAWCHNPETKKYEPEILHYPEKCIGCGMCDDGCYAGAKVVCGKEYTKDEVMREILLDRDYYKNGGGVTFSGGEPLAQSDFLGQLIDECKKENIHCAIETSLVIYNEEIFKKLDLIMADFKIWDSDIHKEFVGVNNEKIKENFIKLNSLGVPIIARTPVICEIEQGIDKISEFLKGLSNVVQYELLPYHPLGTVKSQALGKEQRKFEIPDKKYMEELLKYVFIR